MNSKAVRFFHRYSIHTLAPALLLMSACATAPPPPRYVSEPVPDLAGTHWTVTTIDGRSPLGGDYLTADFGVDGRVNGDSGCNHFSSPFVQSGETVNFGEVLSTRRACAEEDRQRQEDRMLSILRGPTTVNLVRNELRVRGESGSLTLAHADVADAAYVSEGRIEGGPVLDTDHPRRVDYECQGIRISVEYGVKVARVTWPDGYDVLEIKPSKSSDAEIRYESAHSELRLGRDLLWGREGALPRSCLEYHR